MTYHFSRRLVFKAAASAALVPVLGGLARPAMAQTYTSDAFSVMLNDRRFTTWVKMITAAGLENGARSAIFTVFAVTDAGFAKFPTVTKQLLGYQQQSGSHNAEDAFPDTSKIVSLIRSHTISGKHDADAMAGKSTTFTTIAGTPLTINATQKPTTIMWKSQVLQGKDLTATVPDVPLVTSNAVIYPIDEVGLTG